MLVQEMIARSMRLIRVLDPSEAPEAADYETGIVALNGMMIRKEANGLALGWANVVSPGDVIPIPPEAEEPVAYMLAVRLAAEYGVVPDQWISAAAGQGEEALRRDVLVANPLRLQTNMPCGTWGYGRWDIRYGGPIY